MDIAGFVTYLKDHSMEHGFHVHDERHFVETYSLRQAWEIDVHPADACGGPLDLHVALEVDPRVLLGFEDFMAELDMDEDPQSDDVFPLVFNWSLPPLRKPPDLLVLAAELAGVAGPALPIEVASTDSFAPLDESPEKKLSLVGRIDLRLTDIWSGQADLCDVLDRAREVSELLVKEAQDWVG